jgi:hypothetical protein
MSTPSCFLSHIQQAFVNNSAVLTATVSAAADGQQEPHLPATTNKQQALRNINFVRRSL